MATDKNNIREESEAIKNIRSAKKRAYELKELGYKEIVIDIYKPSVNFDGSINKDDIVWTDWISI